MSVITLIVTGGKVEVPLREGEFHLEQLQQISPKATLVFFRENGSCVVLDCKNGVFCPPEGSWDTVKAYYIWDEERGIPERRQLDEIASTTSQAEQELQLINDTLNIIAIAEPYHYVKKSPFTFYLHDFDSELEESKSWDRYTIRSPMFFGSKGYRGSLEFRLQGAKKGDEKFISANFRLIVGPLDYALDWPCKGTLSVYLKNVADNQNDLIATLDMKAFPNLFGKPTCDMTQDMDMKYVHNVPVGWPCFLNHKEIEKYVRRYNEKGQCGEEDCCKSHVEVTVKFD